MSENYVSPIDELPINDELVSDYLQENPNFFIRHPNLLATLRLQESKSGVTSLVERQQQVLRAKNHQLEEEITHLLSIAQHNEQLFGLYSELYLLLIDCQSLTELLDCLQRAVVELMSLSSFKLWLIDNKLQQHDSIVSQDCQGIMNNRLSKTAYYFGRLQQLEQQRIFGDISGGSAVLIKLNHQGTDLGFIAINSQDDHHFEPQMDTLLLNQFSQLVAKLLCQHLVQL